MRWQIFTTKLLRSYVEYEVEAPNEEEAIAKWDAFDYTTINETEPEVDDEVYDSSYI